MAERVDARIRAAARQFDRWQTGISATKGLRDPNGKLHPGKVSIYIADETSETRAFRDTHVGINIEFPGAELIEVWNGNGTAPHQLSLEVLDLPRMVDRHGRPFPDHAYNGYAQSWLDIQAARAEEQARRARGGTFVDLIPVYREYADARDTRARLAAEEHRHRRRVKAINIGLREMNDDTALEQAAVPFAPELRGIVGGLLGERKTDWGHAVQGWTLEHLIPDSPAESRVPTRSSGAGARVVDREKGTRYGGVLGVVEKIVRK